MQTPLEEKLQRMRTIKIVYGLFLVAVFGLLLSAGCTVKNRGTSHPNTPPKVFFSTVPVAGTIFTKPDQFFWYATDRDGYITEFQYALQPDSLVGIARAGANPDSAVRAFLAVHPLDTDTIWHWVVVDNISRNGQTDTIALPTSSRVAGDTVTRNSVVFVRARDDRGALSSDSLGRAANSAEFNLLYQRHPNSIAYRIYGRKNRPPDTWYQSISVCNKSPVGPGVPIFYSLDDSTYDPDPFLRVGHCGITIRWVGTDSLDYPNQTQPAFDYFWELFGPFPSQTTVGGGDSTKLWASTTYPVRYPGTGPTSLRTFTSTTSTTFYGLKGFDTLTNFRPGYYLFRVRARDDAGVADPAPATNAFVVIHPRFDRSVLLISKQPIDTSIFARGDASPPAVDSFKVQNYYLKMIRDAGYGSLVDSAQDVKFFTRTQAVPESLLGRYKLVIFHKDFVFPSQGVTPFLASLKAYMDAGGSVWGFGRDDLSDLGTIFNAPDPAELPFDLSSPINGVGYFYFGVEKMHYSAHSLSVARDSITREEFIGADPLKAGFPPLAGDSDLVKTLEVSRVRKDTSRYRLLPGVNYFVRGPRSENLYLFRSPVGVADTSHLNGKVVAFRSDRVYFKSSYFGFPLYFIRPEGAACVVSRMLEWFLKIPPPDGPPPCPSS